jgi:cellulose synthase/poly-beta-1,6-N-acetylglucosamine synthase-like glycosyltransferase
MTLDFTAVIFWLSLAILIYTFIGYPGVVFVLAKICPRSVKENAASPLPSVTVVMAAHNEEERIVPRLENLLSSKFPEDRLNIVVVSDGSTDSTVGKIRSLNHPRITVLVQPQRSGKAQCLNIGLAAATGEIVVLGDVRQRFDAETIAELVAHFADPTIGAVSGSLEIENAATAIGGGVDAYWRLEKFLRLAESRFDSSIGCTGAVYAIRRALFKELPPDTLLDDVVVPMQIAVQNYRVIFEPRAKAFDPQSLEPDREKIRKQRTLAGNYQMLFRYPHWLLPWRNRLWWQLLSHKYLRLAAPFLMVAAFVSNAALREIPVYRLLFAGQCLFYLLAVIGAIFSSWKLPVFSIPAGFVFLNLMSLRGLRHYLRGSYRQGSWPVSKS